MFVLVGTVLQLQAQETTQGIHYQAVARNSFNQPLVNMPVALKIAIAGDETGQKIHYSEQQTVMTNEQGLFTVVIGKGEQQSGALADIPWSKEQFWLKVEMAGDKDKAFNVLSHNRFMAVPYAMHALSASTLAPQTDEPIEKNQSIYWTTGGNTNTSPATHFLGTRDNKDLYLKTSNTTRVILTKEGQMRVKSGVSGAEDNKDNYPVLIQGSNQGIYIKVTGSRDGSNNFMTFADDVNTQWWGAVEGQTVPELEDTWEYKLQTALFVLQGVSLLAQAAEQIAMAAGGAASGFGAGAAIGSVGLSVAFIAKGAALLAQSIVYNTKIREEIGVTYSTGAADYAEWLERMEEEPKMRFGQIVGVKGGKISLNTSEADHFRVVSSKPGIVGNMPKAELKSKFEKVAFMGQVKVKIAGSVAIGDYIIPSGNNDGYGVAIHPKLMKIGDYRRIVGVAWEAAEDAPINYVNVAIGIGSNELSGQVELLEKKVSNIRGYLKGQNPLVAGDPAFATSAALQNFQTTLQKQLSDEEFDAMMEQNEPMIKEMYARVKINLQEQGLDINAYPKLIEFFENPLPIIKQVRRDPNFITQWAMIDQKIKPKK